jgi:hypothetical protein
MEALSKAESQVIQHLRSLPYGTLVVVKRDGLIKRMEITQSIMVDEVEKPKAT